jgi:Zn-finger nucleic acid-binding protein
VTSPYRESTPAGARCIACGAERLADARVCLQCGAEASAVRCAACMTLNAVGEDGCVHCGAALEPEPELAPTNLVCPRGCGGLSVAGDVLECTHCGGLFLSNEALADLVVRHDTEHASTSIRPPALPPDHVTYIPCPKCNARMNRTVFGKSSGVIVDVCKQHGTWFDARELTASLAFIERGGLALLKRREAERRAEEARSREVERRTKGLDTGILPHAGPVTRSMELVDAANALGGLVDLLLSL